MKLVRTVLAGLMLAFAAVQLNDPDGIWWIAVYAGVGVALGIAAWRASWLRGTGGRVALGALIVVLAVLVVVRWPTDAGFWHQEIWWESETAREGMGLMIAFAASLFALPVAFGRARPGRAR